MAYSVGATSLKLAKSNCDGTNSKKMLEILHFENSTKCHNDLTEDLICQARAMKAGFFVI